MKRTKATINQMQPKIKRKRKREDSKEDKLQPRNTVFQKNFQRIKIQTTSPKL
jgi:hypothetical protein